MSGHVYVLGVSILSLSLLFSHFVRVHQRIIRVQFKTNQVNSFPKTHTKKGTLHPSIILNGSMVSRNAKK